MIRVAVISDTHDYVPAGLTDRMAGADEIWHLGDVCEPRTLDLFRALGRPLFVVLGNNEDHELWPLERRLERGGHRFLLTHIAPTRCPPNVDFVLHGHTHVTRDETDAAGVRWLNPGCIARAPRATGPTFAWLEIEAGKAPGWRLEKV
jgi:putative phosphoesterase